MEVSQHLGTNVWIFLEGHPSYNLFRVLYPSPFPPLTCLSKSPGVNKAKFVNQECTQLKVKVFGDLQRLNHLPYPL